MVNTKIRLIIFFAAKDGEALHSQQKQDQVWYAGNCWSLQAWDENCPDRQMRFSALSNSCRENALVLAYTLFLQHKRWLYTWTSPDGQHRNQIDYILCSQRWRRYIWSAKTRPGPDCGSDHELFIAKFRLKLKKVRKTTRPFRYDLYQIPYDYTVEVRNSRD